MSLLSRAGYRKLDDSSSSVDIGKIETIGAAVLFSTFVAITNWGFAGYSNSEGMQEQTRWIIAAFSSLCGALTVLVFDKGFIYISDIQSPETSILKTFVYAIFRVAILVAISSITAHAIIPLLLKSELSVEALKMQESSEKQRNADLTAIYQVDDKAKTVNTLTSEVERHQKALANLPADVADKIEAYKNCWVNYKYRKSSLKAQGYSTNGIRAELSGVSANCQIKENQAINARNQYLNAVKSDLSQAREREKRAYNALSEAEGTIKEKTTQAEQVESISLTSNSVLVLDSLLKNNEAARYKYYLLNLLLMCFELLPILLKFMLGQSNIGYRLYADSLEERIDIETALKQKQEDFEITKQVSKMAVKAIHVALENPEIQAIFIHEFSKIAGAAAPFEAVRTLLHELSSRQQDVDQFIKKHPRFARVVATAFNNALKESASILSGLSAAQAQSTPSS